MRFEPQTGRQMGVWAATAIVTGEAISLGIFLTPAGMARSLGSPALLAAVWCGMAFLTLAAALVLAGLPVRWLLLRNKQIIPELAAETELS